MNLWYLAEINLDRSAQAMLEIGYLMNFEVLGGFGSYKIIYTPLSVCANCLGRNDFERLSFGRLNQTT